MNDDFMLQLEIPSQWFDNPYDGARHRQFWCNLCVAVARIGCNVNFVDIPFGADKAPRNPPKNGVLLSYHSVGSADRVWRIKETYIPPFYAVDRTGHSGWSELCRNSEIFRGEINAFPLERARNRIASLRTSFERENLSKYPQSEDELTVDDGFIFFATQVQDDAVQEFSRFSSTEAIKKLSALAQKNRTHVVVKRHQFCSNVQLGKIISDEVASNDYFHITNASIHTVIPRARAVLVANSGVGFEALVHGRPVYMFGRSEYESAAVGLNNLDDIDILFSEIELIDEVYRDKFIGYFLDVHCVDGSDAVSIETKIREILRDSEFDLKSNPERERVSAILDSFGSVELQRRANFQLAADFDDLRREVQVQKALLTQAEADRQNLIAEADADRLALITQAEADRQNLTAEAEADRLALITQAEADRQNLIAEADADRLALITQAEADRQNLIAEAEAERWTLLSQLKAADSVIQVMKKSTSWRVTSPMRWIVRFLRAKLYGLHS